MKRQPISTAAISCSDHVVEAFLWEALGASALLIAYVFAPSRGVIAAGMALGTGLLIGSVSFELIDGALKTRTVGLLGLMVLEARAGLRHRGLADRPEGWR